MDLSLIIKAGVLGLLLANASLFWTERSKLDFTALIGANLVTLAAGALILLLVTL